MSTDKEKMIQIIERTDKKELEQKYPVSQYVWEDGYPVVNVSGNVRKRAGKPKGTKNLDYKSGGRFTPKRQKQFLENLKKTGSIQASAAACGVNRRTIYLHTDKSPAFKSRVEQAKELFVANLEQIVDDRVRGGNFKDKLNSEGKLVERIVTYDNTLLTRYLERHSEDWQKKSKSENTVNHNHNSSGAVNKLAEMLGVSIEKPDNEKEIDIDGEYVEK